MALGSFLNVLGGSGGTGGGGGGGGGSPAGSAGDFQTYATSTTFGAVTPGTGVATAFAINVGTDGAFITRAGNAGTPSALVGTNISGTGASFTAGTATNAVNVGITNDNATNASMDLVWVTTSSGNLPAKVSSTQFTVNPSTGALSLAGPLLAGTAATTAGAVTLTQGTTQSTGTTNITLQAPTSVTSYVITLPSTVGATGMPLWTVASTTATVSIVTALPANFTVTTPTSGSSTVLAGYMGMPQNSKSAAYTTVLGDMGEHILHPTADNNPRTFTIDSNANVAYPIGTVITFVNQINTVTIAITSDTLTWYNGSGTGSTGSRTLAAGGLATALKITSTSWVITGPGVS